MTAPKHRRSSSLFGIRSVVGPLTKRVPALHRALVAVYHMAVLEVKPRVARVVSGRGAAPGRDEDLAAFLSLQRELVLELRVGAPNTRDAAASANELVASLRGAGCTVMEGGWTIYVPPSPALSAVVPQMAMYPAGTGLKILKDFRPPEQALYAAHHLRPSPGAAAARARTPAPRELLRVAASLHAAGIAPRTHDLVELRVGGGANAARLTAFACQHVEGSPPTGAQHAAFLERLNALLKRGAIGLVHGGTAGSSDFVAPDCNGNLVQASPHALFVDAQSFCFNDERAGLEQWAQRHAHALGFGAGRLGRGSRYLYQTVPGLGPAKRGTLDRWERLDALLREAGVDLANRVTFDIGCNSGLMSYYALARGAAWAYGWDRPATAAAAAELVPMLGGSRFTATGADISDATGFAGAVHPAHAAEQSGVLFFLSVSDHIGFPPGVRKLPWGACVYEGHNGQSVQTALEMVNGCGWFTGMQVRATALWRDGDSPARPVLVLK